MYMIQSFGSNKILIRLLKKPGPEGISFFFYKKRGSKSLEKKKNLCVIVILDSYKDIIGDVWIRVCADGFECFF